MEAAEAMDIEIDEDLIPLVWTVLFGRFYMTNP